MGGWQHCSVVLGVSLGSSEQLGSLLESGIDNLVLDQAAGPQRGTEMLSPTPGFPSSALVMFRGGCSFVAGAVLCVLGC